MRRGISLAELLVVLAIVGVLTAIAAPAAAGLLAQAFTEAAARQVAAAHRVARFTAIRRNAVALIVVTPDSVVVRAVQGRDTVTAWRADGPAAHGVAFSGPGRPLSFAPNGLPLGIANATFRFSRGSASRQLIISRLGRIRIVSGE